MVSVGWSEKRKRLKLRHYDSSRKEQPRDSFAVVFKRKMDRNSVKTNWSIGPGHERYARCVAHPNSRMYARMAEGGDDFVFGG